jgi:AcrR family transcriptional regulator
MTAEPIRVDRRQRRRLETIEEIVDVAVEVMTEYGVGGLSLGEVARRMGMRTPSLYVYFDSKNALYDAVFARGWRAIGAAMEQAYAGVEEAVDLPAYFLATNQHFLRWMVEHPVHAQLMSWRPVPGYEPSEQAYAPAVEVLAAGAQSFARMQELGLFRADLDSDLLLQTWTALMSGVMTQQLANAPDESFDEGRFTTALPEIAAMFLNHYGPRRGSRSRGTS